MIPIHILARIVLFFLFLFRNKNFLAVTVSMHEYYKDPSSAWLVKHYTHKFLSSSST